MGFGELGMEEEWMPGVGYVPDGTENCLVQCLEWAERNVASRRANMWGRGAREFLRSTKKKNKHFRKFGASTKSIKAISDGVTGKDGWEIMVWKVNMRGDVWTWENTMRVARRDIRWEKTVNLTLIDFDGEPYSVGAQRGDEEARKGVRHWVVIDREVLEEGRRGRAREFRNWTVDYMSRQKVKYHPADMGRMVAYHRRMESVRDEDKRQSAAMDGMLGEDGRFNLLGKYTKASGVLEGVFDIESYQSDGERVVGAISGNEWEGLRALGMEYVGVDGDMHIPCMCAYGIFTPGFFQDATREIEMLQGPRPRVLVGEDCLSIMLGEVSNLAVTAGAKKVILYAHNAKKYDAFVMLGHVRGFRVENILRTPQGMLVLRYAVGEVKVEIRCTLAHVDASLARACKDLGVPEEFWKLKFDTTRITRDNYRTLSQDGISLQEYQEFDVWALLHLFRNMHLAYAEMWGPMYHSGGLSMFNPFITSVSMSRRLFELYYKNKPIEVPQLYQLRKAMRMAMRGGMVQAFWREGRVEGLNSFLPELNSKLNSTPWHPNLKAQRAGWFNHLRGQESGLIPLDCNSLYPAVMRWPMPVGGLEHVGPQFMHMLVEEYWYGGADIRKIEFGFFKVRVDSCEKCPISVTSYRMNGTGQLRYLRMPSFEAQSCFEELDLDPSQFCDYGVPHNHDDCKWRGYTWVSTWDILIYELCGIEYSVGDGLVWTEMEPVFSRMMCDMYERRKKAKREGKGALQMAIKKMLNALYGSQAMQDIVERDVVVDVDSEGNVEKMPAAVTESTIQLNKCEILPGGVQAVLRYKASVGNVYSPSTPVQVACAILAAARYHMFHSLYEVARAMGRDMSYALSAVAYMDTDSFYISRQLFKGFKDSDLIGDELGQFKHDYADKHGDCIIVDMFSPAPKIRLMTMLKEDGSVAMETKCKGMNCSGIAAIEALFKLREDWALTVNRTKWFRDLHRISVRPQPYQIGEEAVYDPYKHLSLKKKFGMEIKEYAPILGVWGHDGQQSVEEQKEMDWE